MSDAVFVRGLEFEGNHGYSAAERRGTRRFRVSLSLERDLAAASASDKIADTLDYKAVSKRLIAFVEASNFELVETLAEHCARIVREEFGVSWLRLRLAKPGAVRGAKAVGVVIERGKRPD